MGLQPSQFVSKSSIPPISGGSHAGICVQILDLGTHYDDTYGKNNRKVRFTWELPEETHVFDEKKGEEPRLISKTYNFSSHEKSTFIKDMVAWVGKELPKDFDIENQLGKGCMLNVTQENKAGKVYSNISGISQLPKIYNGKLPKPQNPVFYWSIDSGKDSTFESLPDFLKEMANSSQEWTTETPDDAAANQKGEKEPDWTVPEGEEGNV